MKHKFIVVLVLLFLVFTIMGCQGNFFTKIYTIGGTVTTIDGEDLEGVKISIISTDTIVETDYYGRWTLSGITGKGTVQPVKDGWSFSPPQKDFEDTDLNIDFVGTPDDGHHLIYEVSGKIFNTDGTLVTAAVIIGFERNGEVIGTAVTDGGSWAKERLWGTVVVRPLGIPPDFAEQFSPETKTVDSARNDVDFVMY